MQIVQNDKVSAEEKAAFFQWLDEATNCHCSVTNLPALQRFMKAKEAITSLLPYLPENYEGYTDKPLGRDPDMYGQITFCYENIAPVFLDFDGSCKDLFMEFLQNIDGLTISAENKTPDTISLSLMWSVSDVFSR